MINRKDFDANIEEITSIAELNQQADELIEQYLKENQDSNQPVSLAIPAETVIASPAVSYSLPTLREDILVQLKALLKYGSPIFFTDNFSIVPKEDYSRIYKKKLKFFIDDRQINNVKHYRLKDILVDTVTKEPLHKNFDSFKKIGNNLYTTDDHFVVTFNVFQRRYRFVYTEGEKAGHSIPKDVLLEKKDDQFYFNGQLVIPKNTHNKRKSDKILLFSDGEEAGNPIPPALKIMEDENGSDYVLYNEKKRSVISRNKYQLRKRNSVLVFDDTGEPVSNESIITGTAAHRSVDGKKVIARLTYREKQKKLQKKTENINFTSPWNPNYKGSTPLFQLPPISYPTQTEEKADENNQENHFRIDKLP